MSPVDRHRQPPAPIASASPIPGSYENLAELYTDWRSDNLSGPAIDNLLSGCPGHATLTVEAGCGPGLVTAALAARVDCLISFDASPTMVATTRKRLAEAGVDNVCLLLADAARLPLRPGSADLVVACYLLHLTELRHTLPALAQAVRPGGTFFIVDTVHRWPRFRRTGAGWIWWGVAWPVRVLAHGGRRQAGKLFRLVWSAGWRRISTTSGYDGPTFAAACRCFLPGCVVELKAGFVKATWNPHPEADLAETTP